MMQFSRLVILNGNCYDCLQVHVHHAQLTSITVPTLARVYPSSGSVIMIQTVLEPATKQTANKMVSMKGWGTLSPEATDEVDCKQKNSDEVDCKQNGKYERVGDLECWSQQ